VTRLVVGLGNPGPKYEWTPHNLGFHVVETLARGSRSIFQTPAALGLDVPTAGCLLARDAARDAWLAKPMGYVNASGSAVAPLVRSLGIAPDALAVVYDDLDLPLGALRIRPHGGHGGHNGVRSIVEALGHDRFPRLRIGVGRPRTDAARHVLSRLEGDERRAAEVAVAEAADALGAWLDAGDLERVMTRFHSRWKDQGP
jgi:PTH1 family peptidyl-tRNA hydrolase